MAQFRNLAARYNAFNLRERVLIVAVLLAILYALADLLWFTPQAAEAKRLNERIKAQAVEQAALTKAVAQLAAKPASDPAGQQQQERDQLQAFIQDAQKIVAQASTELRPGEVIRTLTSSASGVKLVSLKTLPSQLFFDPLAPSTAKAATAPAPGASAAAAPAGPVLPRLYRHRVEVAIKGPYPSVVAYLQALERSTPGVFWENLRLEAKYPESTMRFTLSVVSTHSELVLE
jgi:MSHA biogenesis protein MshJ